MPGNWEAKVLRILGHNLELGIGSKRPDLHGSGGRGPHRPWQGREQALQGYRQGDLGAWEVAF